MRVGMAAVAALKYGGIRRGVLSLGLCVLPLPCCQVVMLQGVVFLAAFAAAFALRVLGDDEVSSGVSVSHVPAIVVFAAVVARVCPCI